MTDAEHPRGQMVFQSRLTSPKSDEQVGASEYNNGPVLAFKVYPKGWDDGDHVISREVRSPQADNDIDDIEESERLGESINLPPMLSPPPRYVPSQDFSQSMPSLNNDGQFGSATGGEPFVCSYQKAIDENPLSPTTEQRRTKREHVIDEIISTELSYVKDLSQIIDGYQTPLVENMDSLGVTDGDILALFNNIEEIKDFNEFMLKSLQQCKDDIKQIAKCFITIWENAEGFKIYSDYCTKYPRAIEVWGKYAKHTAMTNFFKKCQQKLGHMLPLGAYLLKPVQRVLKYSLLLEKINDCLSTGEDGKEDIIAAVETMGKVGEQINEMKKKYEATVKLQEIQAQLDGWDGNDLTTYGDLVCQDTFRFLGGKPVNASIRLTTERHLFLFQRLLLMTKKKEDHFVCKQRINVEDLQVLGSIPRYPSCFQLRQISTTRVFTFQARTVSLKDDWVKVINRILVDSVDMDIPNRAKLLLFAGIPASDHHSLTPDMGKKKRHGTLDVASGKKVQKSSSFRRQNTPYDHHKARPLHVGRAESPDEAAFRSRAHTTATTTSHKSYLKSSSLLRHEKGHSKLPNVTRNDQTDAVTPSHTPVLRSRSTHASPVTDKKTDDTRRSSDITSPTLLDDDDSDEMEEGTNNSKVVKKNFSKSRHSRHNAVKRRSTSSITSPPTSPTFSVSSDDQPPANTSLPVAELENLRCVSQHSNYTSVSSAASMDDLVIAISSPDHVPTENGVYSSDLSEFPSVGIPAGRKLQESSLVVSTSDICLESRDSPVKSPVKSPIIMVDVFDDDVLSGTEDGCMSPTTELHATNGAATHDSIIATNASEIISKLEDSPEAAAEIIVPDVDILSQEILSHISTVGMTLDEDLFAKLPGECSPVIQRKYSQNSEQTPFPSATVTSTPHQTGMFPSSSFIDDTSYDPSSLPGSDHGSSFSPIGSKDSSTPTTRHRYQNSHQLARKMASSNIGTVSKDSEHYHVHVSPHVNKHSKQIRSSVASSNLINSPHSSPKFTQHDKYQASSVASPPVSRQWRELSPQNSDEPNEEFVLPPPPQFQSGDITDTYDTTHVDDETVFTNRNTDSPRRQGIARSSSSASRLTNSKEHSSPTTNTKSLDGRKHSSASGLLSVDNGDEEVLLTDMLKSLDQMAEEKYHAELRRQLSKEKNLTIPRPGAKTEKPPEKKKEKKKPKRRSTVGIFSFEDLIKQSIREDRAISSADSPPNSKNDDNKVKKLAREYSKRVKDRPVFGKKRFSVHSYENFSGSETNTPELRAKDPSWKTTADEHRMAHSRGPPLSPSVDPKRKLPSISSGAEMDFSSSAGRGVSAKSSSSITSQTTRDYNSHPSPKINKFKSSPVVRSSSPIRSRIEGFEMLSQPKDDVAIPPRVIVGQSDLSKSKNPLQFPAKGKSFVNVNHMKSQEDLNSTSNGANSNVVTGKRHEQPHNLSVHSRELSKSHGSLNPSRTSSKQYRGLSVFSPDKVDDSDVIYRPPSYGGKDEFENIRVKGGFKGWVRNIVDKFSK